MVLFLAHRSRFRSIGPFADGCVFARRFLHIPRLLSAQFRCERGIEDMSYASMRSERDESDRDE